VNQEVVLNDIELGGGDQVRVASEDLKRRCGRAMRFIWFAGISLIQTGQIVSDPAVGTGCLLSDLAPSDDAFGARDGTELRGRPAPPAVPSQALIPA
jgi:hypothetical protein